MVPIFYLKVCVKAYCPLLILVLIQHYFSWHSSPQWAWFFIIMLCCSRKLPKDTQCLSLSLPWFPFQRRMLLGLPCLWLLDIFRQLHAWVENLIMGEARLIFLSLCFLGHLQVLHQHSPHQSHLSWAVCPPWEVALISELWRYHLFPLVSSVKGSLQVLGPITPLWFFLSSQLPMLNSSSFKRLRIVSVPCITLIYLPLKKHSPLIHKRLWI